jgi:inner membrane protein
VFLLGHLGIGLGLAWLLSWKSTGRVDYRLVLFGTILPDLIDKPLGYVLGLEGRIWAHTFVFLYAILALSFLPRLWDLRLVGFGVATHFLLDRLWETPRIILYPAYGWAFNPAIFDSGRWFDTLFHDPYVQAGEIVGAAILILFAWRKGLAHWAALWGFVRHGTLPGGHANQPSQG